MGEMHARLARYGLAEWWPEASWSSLPSYEDWCVLVALAVHEKVQEEWRLRLAAMASLDVYRDLKSDLAGRALPLLRRHSSCRLCSAHSPPFWGP